METAGYTHLATYDHVLGANVANRPDWEGPYTSDDPFHETFVLFGYLAAVTESIELTTHVLILPQRQTALGAKQAASVDVLSGGRLRLGAGVGWNYSGRWHEIPDAGINPLPVQRPIPLWFGGRGERFMRRLAEHGDGWVTLYHQPDDRARSDFDRVGDLVEEFGRDRAQVGVDAWASMGDSSPRSWRKEVEGWRQLGASHLTLNTAFQVAHHRRIAGTSLDEHIDAANRYIDAVGDLL